MENKIIRLGKIKTSKIELIDITKAWIALSLAFAFVYSGITLLDGTFSKIFSTSFLLIMLISFFTAGLGFLLHELAHKFVAQKYGCLAEFRAFDQMLYLAVGLAILTGFIFAAPGAVMIAGNITRRENGIISAVGPITNYVLAMIFLILANFLPALNVIWLTGFGINMWLGLFNMIPFLNFDGKKIWDWSIPIWLAMVGFGVFFTFFFKGF